MASGSGNGLSDKPVVVIIGVIAAVVTIIGGCIAIFVFATGIEHLTTILNREPTEGSAPSTPGAKEAFVTVPGDAREGLRWCTTSGGHHTIGYVSGAYSPWPTDEGCDPKGCWKSAIFIYKNSDTDSIFADAGGEPLNPVLQVSWNDWEQSPEAVQTVSEDLADVSIDMTEGDCLTFIAIDERDAYGWPAANRGK